MSHLPSRDVVFDARDGGTITDLNQRSKILSNFMAPETLRLRVDAQVMLTKNMDETLVNGSMGRVVRFVDPALFGTELDQYDEDGSKDVEKMKVGGDGKGGKAGGGNKPYPVVEFRTGKNSTPKQVLVMPETWKVELPNGEVQVSRQQVNPE
jgi:ATP-dependent DNA helicase PIF1